MKNRFERAILALPLATAVSGWGEYSPNMDLWNCDTGSREAHGTYAIPANKTLWIADSVLLRPSKDGEVGISKKRGIEIKNTSVRIPFGLNDPSAFIQPGAIVSFYKRGADYKLTIGKNTEMPDAIDVKDVPDYEDLIGVVFIHVTLQIQCKIPT